MTTRRETIATLTILAVIGVILAALLLAPNIARAKPQAQEPCRVILNDAGWPEGTTTGAPAWRIHHVHGGWSKWRCASEADVRSWTPARFAPAKPNLFAVDLSGGLHP